MDKARGFIEEVAPNYRGVHCCGSCDHYVRLYTWYQAAPKDVSFLGTHCRKAEQIDPKSEYMLDVPDAVCDWWTPRRVEEDEK